MHKKIDSLYLHFPFCTHLCNYCDFYKKVPKNKETEIGQYQSYLEDSFQVHNKLIESNGYSFAPLKTIYIGGGTPSLWGKMGKIFLENFFQKNGLVFESEYEFTLEVNPGAWTEESLDAWREFGVNRFSLGIQSYHSEMIKYLDRVHNLEDVVDTLNYFSKHNLNFSVDFMLGLPFSENKRNILEELAEIIKYNPSHFSVYILTVKENYPFIKNLPSEEWIEQEFKSVSSFLLEKGFDHYEVSNFCLPGKHSVHNMNYWESKTVAAFGPSATGFLAENKLRYKWKPNSPQFDLEELNESEYKLEEIYMALRSMKGLELDNLEPNFVEVLNSWEKRKIGKITGGKFRLNSQGYLILDSLMNELFSLKLL